MIRNLFILIFIYFIQISPSVSSVTINKTRVIFNEGDKVATITLNSNNERDSLIQLWVDNGELEAKPSTIDVPFILNPQIKELMPNQAQVVKIRHIGNNKPQQNEELYWLNLLEVPKKVESEKNYIQLAYRTRIKLFYRPSNINEKSQSESSESLIFSLVNDTLEIKNISPFYITIINVKEKDRDDYRLIENSNFMISPKSSKYLTIDSRSYSKEFKYTYINDWGGKKEVIKTLGN